MSEEPEIKAMMRIYEILERLDDDAKKRTVQWVISKFALDKPLSPSIQSKAYSDCSDSVSLTNTTGDKRGISKYSSAGDLLAVVTPPTNRERVLVVASYLQVSKNDDSGLTGFEINKVLTHLGHKSTNITVDINGLKKKKPSLMIQTKKGKNLRSNKEYRVTEAGLDKVMHMINQNAGVE